MSEGTWRIYLLGRLQAQSEQTTLNHLSMRRIGALLACLALRAPHPVPREELLELLWPEEPIKITRNRLRVLLNSLRQLLEPSGIAPSSVLSAERDAVQLVSAAFTSDFHDFLQALQAAKTAVAEREGVGGLETAVALYRGELLTGFYDEWILPERRRLAELRYQALRDLVSRFTRLHAPERAIEYARQAVAAEPLDEEAHCDLIRLYEAIGQPSTGLRQYEQMKRLLWEELQARPSVTARQLAAQIEAGIGHGMTQTRRAIRPMTLRASEQAEKEQDQDTLPRRLTRFFGREEEIALLRVLLAPRSDIRLVSLLGPGGTGKTRLATETAAQLHAEYAGRVYFAPLAEIVDTHHIGSVIAKALRLPPSSDLDPLSQSIAVLSQAPSLLVLDNLEQILPEAASQIEHLLLEVASLRCLLTSRVSAGIEGEQEIALGSLPQPRVGISLDELSACPGVALFVDRVCSVRSDFALTLNNAEDVAQLCRDLEGLPLAIELAAARARVMTPGEMRKQTGKLLSWLVDARGGKTARHRSLRATLEWSFRLLPLEERRFYSAVSVFIGGFSVEAAGYVGLNTGAERAEAVTMLERLRAASMVSVRETEEGVTRLGLLEPLREFGLERLAENGDETDTRRRHLAYFAEALWQASPIPFQWTAQESRLITAEDGNLREALEFGLREEACPEVKRLTLKLAAKLSGYWEILGRWSEGRGYLHRVGLLPEAAESPEIQVMILQGAGSLANLQGDYAEANALSSKGLALAQGAGDLAGTAGCLRNLGSVAFSQDDYAGSQNLFEQALRLFKQTEQETHVAACLVSLGNVAFYLGDHRAAEERLQEALNLYRQSGDRHGVATALLRLGNVRRNQSHFAEGRKHLLEALEIFKEEGHPQGAAGCLQGLGLAAFFQSDYAEAQERFTEALNIFQEIGSRRGVGTCLGNLGNVAQDRGDYAEATSYYGQAIQIYHKLGDRRNLAACLYDLAYVALNQGHFEESLARFNKALTLEQEIGSRGGIANCLAGLGRLALEQDTLLEARLRLSEALEIYQSMGVQAGVAEMLEAHALLAGQNNQLVSAARLAGAASSLRKELNFFRSAASPRWPAALASIRSVLGDAVFTSAWKQGEALSSRQAVAEALYH